MNKTERLRPTGKHGLIIAAASWLSMTLGLFTAGAAGNLAREAGMAAYWSFIVQGVVMSTFVLTVVYVLKNRYSLPWRLLPFTAKGMLHFLCGSGTAVMLGAAGFAVLAVTDEIVVTGWSLSPEVASALMGNVLFALLYEALPEELSLRGLLYSGLRLRLPVFWAYAGQIALFILVPVTVVFLQRLTGLAEGSISAEYVILLAGFGFTLQLWRTLTGSLWASVGFHLAYLVIARFAVAQGEHRILSYTEETAGTGEVFILFGMMITGSAAVLIALIIRRHWLARNKTG